MGVVTVAVVLSTCAARHPDPQHPTLHTHTFPGNVLVQNPPTGTIFAADRPDTLQVTPVDEETWPVQYKSLRRNDVELGAHSVLYDAIEVNVTRGVTNFTVGPFHAPDIISDRPKAQDDVIFDNQILARMPPAHDRRPVYVREFRVRFVDMDGNPWPDIPMWLRQFQFVKVHNATMFCRRSEVCEQPGAATCKLVNNSRDYDRFVACNSFLWWTSSRSTTTPTFCRRRTGCSSTTLLRLHTTGDSALRLKTGAPRLGNSFHRGRSIFSWSFRSSGQRSSTTTRIASCLTRWGARQCCRNRICPWVEFYFKWLFWLH